MLLVERITVGALFTNSYIVYDSEKSVGIIVDAGDEADKILATVDRRDVKIRGIFLTHGHFDHLLAVRDLKADLNCKLYLHPADREILSLVPHDARYFLGRDVPPPPEPDEWLIDGQSIKVGRYYGKVIHTPGHTPGSVCFLFKDMIFTGDTLFAGSIGRTDLPGGSLESLLSSLKNKVLKLPDDFVIYPGHGPSSTIGVERRLNPFIRHITELQDSRRPP